MIYDAYDDDEQENCKQCLSFENDLENCVNYNCDDINDEYCIYVSCGNQVIEQYFFFK